MLTDYFLLKQRVATALVGCFTPADRAALSHGLVPSSGIVLRQRTGKVASIGVALAA